MLTKKQKQILDFVKKYSTKKSFAPSLEEIKKHFRLRSVATVHQHIATLRDKGYLHHQKNQPRGITATKLERMLQIPVLGRISAGQPIEAIEDKETIAIPQNQLPFHCKDYYALRVSGNSMIDENINDGDTVLIKQQNTAKNGQKVVALIDNYEATLKKFYKEKNQIRLQPANKSMSPLLIKNDHIVNIQGIVVDVIKNDKTEQLIQPFILTSKNTGQRGKISDYLNKVYNGDIMDLLKDLPDNSIDTIFGDPDYNVGIKYGGNNYTRDFDDYINWYIELTKESMRVLKHGGNLFMLNYPKQNAHLRVKYLDLYFPHINDYTWVYNTNVGHTPKRFTTAHRSILHVRKSTDNKFFKDAVALPYKNPSDKRIRQNLENGSKGRMPYSWFEFNLVKNVSKEKTYHACQIPQKLTEMLIKATTNPGDIVLVLFGGSGAEIDVCKNLNRQFISAEIDKKYCDIINDRLANGFIASQYKLFRGRKRIEV